MIWPLRAAGCMAAPEPSRLGTMRVVIADAGPLIGLARIGCLDLLRALFGGVTITAVVAAEIGIDPRDIHIHPWPGASAIAEALAAGWLRIASPSGLPDIEPLNPGVDPGERSTIALALHWQAAGAQVLVIVDDRCGRAEARCRGLPILGTAAVLVVAKQQQLIPACAPLMAALREEGYYLSDGLVAAVLAEVDEA
jgi:predicted nucleic acid-binding protein